MVAFRALLLVLLLGAAGCFVAYVVTGQARFRGYGLRLVAWTVGAGLVFFAVLIVQRLLER